MLSPGEMLARKLELLDDELRARRADEQTGYAGASPAGWKNYPSIPGVSSAGNRADGDWSPVP